MHRRTEAVERACELGLRPPPAVAAERRTAPEIGAELYVSLNTVKTHMRHIYAKLGVHRRTDAVDRARELGLVGPSARRLTKTFTPFGRCALTRTARTLHPCDTRSLCADC